MSADPPPERFRVSRARLTYEFDRYALRDELIDVAGASALTGLSREALALMVLQGRLSIVEAVKRHPDDRPPRFLLRAEIEALGQRSMHPSQQFL